MGIRVKNKHELSRITRIIFMYGYTRVDARSMSVNEYIILNPYSSNENYNNYNNFCPKILS